MAVVPSRSAAKLLAKKFHREDQNFGSRAESPAWTGGPATRRGSSFSDRIRVEAAGSPSFESLAGAIQCGLLSGRKITVPALRSSR